MSDELNRLFWRYKSGRCHERRLAARFEGELDRLTGALAHESESRQVLRRSDPAALGDFEAGINRARRCLIQRDYRRSLRLIVEAQGAFRRIQMLLRAASDLEAASSSCARLYASLRSPRLTRLATVKGLARLVAESETLLREGEPQQSRFIARLCRQRVEELQRQRQDEAEEVARLAGRIEQVHRLCAETGKFIAASAPGALDADVVGALRHLLDDGRLTLIESLLDDLEIEHAPRRTFLNEYRRWQNLPAAGAALDESLREILAGGEWAAATHHLWREALKSFSAELRALQRRRAPPDGGGGA